MRRGIESVRPTGVHRKAREPTFVALVLLVGDGTDLSDNLLPTLAHVLESSIVLRQHEAGVDKAKAGAVFNPEKGPRDDSVQPGAVSDVSLVSALPGIDEAFVWYHLQHPAVNGTVPRAGRLRLEGSAYPSRARTLSRSSLSSG